jgi:hypothetical protein
MIHARRGRQTGHLRMKTTATNEPTTAGDLLFWGVWLVLSVALGALACFLLYRSGNELLGQARSLAWQSVDGRIVSSSTRVNKGADGPRGSSRTPTIAASVTYEYTVAGVDYVGHRVQFGDYASSSGRHAADVRSRYPDDKAVRVAYDPAAPEESVLEPGFTGAGLLFGLLGMLFGAGAGALGGGGLYVAIQHARRPRAPPAPVSATPVKPPAGEDPPGG